MDQQSIQALAAEIARHLSGYAWAALLIQIVLTAGAAAVAVFSNAYLKKRAEHLAIQADLAKLQSQLKANTAIVETVKSQLAQRDWVEREWANLRRIKIEELVNKVNECRAYMERHYDAVLHATPVPDGNPINQLNTIAELYLPELKQQKNEFSINHKSLVAEGDKLPIFVARASTEEEKARLKSVYAERGAQMTVYRARVLSEALTVAARELLEKIMGVETPNEPTGRQSDVNRPGTNIP